MAAYSFDGAFRNLNSAVTGFGDAYEEERKRNALAGLGQRLAAGDYAGAAQGLMAAGDVTNGLKALELGRTLEQQKAASAAVAGALGGGMTDLNAPGGGIAVGGAPAPAVNLGTPNQIETRFMSALRESGLNNPFGLATVAAYGKRESGWSPQNANRTWSDPSQSGKAGTSGGLFSWRNERLRNLYKFAQQRGEKIGAISPETQAAFLASEDPTLIPRLNAAKSVDEANRIMANAWRFAGYQGNSPEYNARLKTAMAYLPRFQGQPNTIQAATGQQQTQVAQADAPAEGARPAQGFAVPGQGQSSVRAPMTPQQAQAGMRRIQQVIAATPGLNPAQIKVLEQRYNELAKWADPTTAQTMALNDLKIRQAEQGLSGDKMQREAADRAVVAEQLGLTPGSPAYQSYVLTGKMPREDQQPLTATDKKAILEADEMVEANQGAINSLKTALKLSDKALEGFGASGRAWVANNLPDWMVPDGVASKEQGQATAELENVVVGNALNSLKTIFGGNPTEGERAILLQMQGSASQPKAVREQIYKRAIAAAERRLKFNERRAQEMRGGTYFKAGNSPQSGNIPVVSSPQELEALPSGTTFQAPNGAIKIKP
ncbi:hypothetical protein ACFFJB_14940 [Camelimonas abortus]|uniref:Phage tail lysozyme domain-containing protein n=1 Tax=Camelimonas abortus TaxID=1017184 RepID=A0ABV7LHY0_9HYPH